MDFTKITRAQADEYLEYVVTREPERLTELAHLIANTGGPISELDATLESLVPLNEWYVSFLDAGCPGVPAGLRPSWFGHDPRDDVSLAEQSEADWAADYVAECLEHYIFLVCKNYNPGAQWAVYDLKPRGGMDVDYHSTGIGFGARRPPFVVYGVMGIFTYRIRKGDVRGRQPGRLREVLLLNTGSIMAGQPQHRGVPVLAPYLSAPFPGPAEARRRPPQLVLLNSNEGEPRSRTVQVGEELIFAKGPSAGLEQPGLLSPLPISLISLALASLGFETDDEVDLYDALTIDGASLTSDKLQAVVTTSVVEAQLRALFIEPLSPTRAQWKDLTKRFRAIGRRTGARLAPEDVW